MRPRMARARDLARRRCPGRALVLAALAVSGLPLPAAAERVHTVAGTGVYGFGGDGQRATLADFKHPRGVAALPDGGFLVADAFGDRIRRVWPDGTVSTVAGTGAAGYSGDGGPATAARLNMPHDVAVLPDGGFIIADTNNHRIRKVSADGIIRTAAGTGVKGFSGENGPAKSAKIAAPRGLGVTVDGYLIADSDNHRIRKVSLDNTITTVAGTGTAGFSGDGGLATSAKLRTPFDVSPEGGIGFLIADKNNDRIRRVTAAGTISTVAGTGVAGMSGDGGPATLAQIDAPHAVLALSEGSFLVADTGNHRVREVDALGNIRTVAGTGSSGFSGEWGSPFEGMFSAPKALGEFGGGYLIADASNSRVRLVGGGHWPSPSSGSGVAFVNGAAAYAQSSAVAVDLLADGVTDVRVSSDPESADGVLVKGRTEPAAPQVAYDLADPATGGTGADGVHYVYVQWRDAEGQWSAPFADSIVLDTVPPTATPPVVALPAGTSVGATTVPVSISWTGSDATSGMAGYTLERRAGDGSFEAAAEVGGGTTSTLLSVGPGMHTYRLQPADRAGLAGAWEEGQRFEASLLEESNPAVQYDDTWVSSTTGTISGGRVRYTTTAGGTATLQFEGRAVAWVAQRSSSVGPADLYLDGVKIAAVNLRSSKSALRQTVYVREVEPGPHTLEIRSTSTTRVDVDAFLVLR